MVSKNVESDPKVFRHGMAVTRFEPPRCEAPRFASHHFSLRSSAFLGLAFSPRSNFSKPAPLWRARDGLEELS